MERTFVNLSKPADLKDWGYKTIKRLIFNSEIQAGQQLNIETLSEQMGVSRTPIREALLKLEGEGLIKSASRVGFFVQEVTRQDLDELFELREILESYAAERAAQKLTVEDLEALADFHKQAVKAVRSADLTRFMEMEIALHSLILAKSGNKRLNKMLESIKDLTHRERILSLKSKRNVEESLKEHQRLIEALQKKDGRSAARLMRAHISAVKQRLLDFLDLPDRSA